MRVGDLRVQFNCANAATHMRSIRWHLASEGRCAIDSPFDCLLPEERISIHGSDIGKYPFRCAPGPINLHMHI